MFSRRKTILIILTTNNSFCNEIFRTTITPNNNINKNESTQNVKNMISLKVQFQILIWFLNFTPTSVFVPNDYFQEIIFFSQKT